MSTFANNGESDIDGRRATFDRHHELGEHLGTPVESYPLTFRSRPLLDISFQPLIEFDETSNERCPSLIETRRADVDI